MQFTQYFCLHASTAFTVTLWGIAVHRSPSMHNSTAKSQLWAASRLPPPLLSPPPRLPSFYLSRRAQSLKPPARLRLFLSRAVTTRSDSAYSLGRPVGPPRHYRRPRPAPSGQAGSEKLGCLRGGCGFFLEERRPGWRVGRAGGSQLPLRVGGIHTPPHKKPTPMQ